MFACFTKKKKAAEKPSASERVQKAQEQKKKVVEAAENPAAAPVEEVKRASSKRVSKKSKATYDDFVALLDEYWAASLKASPMSATQMGYHDYDDLLDDVTVESAEEWKKVNEEFLERLDSMFPESNKKRFDGWDLNGKTTFLVLRDQMRHQIEFVELELYLISVCTLSAPHIDLPPCLEKNKFEDEEDVIKFQKRLEAVPKYIKQTCEMLELGLEKNKTQSRVVLDNIPEQIDALLSAESDPFTKIVEENWSKVKAPESMKADLEKAIADQVLPALKEFADFLREFCPKLSEEPAIPKRMTGGEEIYRAVLRYHTTTTMSPQEVHDIGKAEVKRITDMMREIAESEGFTGESAIDDYQDSIDEKCVAESEEDLLAHYRAVAMDISPRLPELFGLLPRTTFGIRPIPAYAAEHAPGAYYLPPPEDLSQPGWFCLNTSFLPTRKTYVAEALVAHEAIPGHHMQIALATENSSLHTFRKFTYQTAYVEGWGLYSEYLGYELGLYKTNESHFGRLQAEILRACRLVVDTGMNYFGWTKQEAMDYMLKYKAGTFEDCDSESTRYLGLPGQACAYKIGEIKIKELRKLAEEKLGKSFKIRDFHDLLIATGSVPLTVLEEIVRDWIKDQQ